MTAAQTAPSVDADAARGLLVDLVSIPSPSGEERAAAERLVSFFEAHGREARIDHVGNVRAPADDALLLTSHVDTVPGDIPVRLVSGDGENATVSGEAEAPADEAEALANEDAVLWGRGSVDATGPLAAMAVAAVETGVSFAGVVGEETDSRGARHLIEKRSPPDAVVNGEPSGTDGITLGYRGLLAGTYRAETPSAHSSRPEPTAIQEAMAWWSTVESVVEGAAGSSEDGVFETATPKPVGIQGGLADDGLSVEASIDVQIRVPPSASPSELRSLVDETLAGSDEDATLDWHESIPPVMADPRTDLSRAFRVAVRAEDGDPRLLRKTGTSDANLYAAAWDCPTVTYGPGDSALDHAPDERTELAEYDRSIRVLERVATEVLEN